MKIFGQKLTGKQNHLCKEFAERESHWQHPWLVFCSSILTYNKVLINESKGNDIYGRRICWKVFSSSLHSSNSINFSLSWHIWLIKLFNFSIFYFRWKCHKATCRLRAICSHSKERMSKFQPEFIFFHNENEIKSTVFQLKLPKILLLTFCDWSIVVLTMSVCVVNILTFEQHFFRWLQVLTYFLYSCSILDQSMKDYRMVA